MEIRLTPWEIILRLIVSAAVGFVVGLDREKHSSAGLRTHMILAVGVCILTLVQVDMTAETIQWYMENPDYIGAVGTNTSRLTAQIVSGIGFLGSGLILIRNDKSVDGMTSAVSLWTVAGISISVGYGEYLVAGLGTAMLLIILVYLNMKSTTFGVLGLNVHFKDDDPDRDSIIEFVEGYDGEIVNYTMEKVIKEDYTEYRYHFVIEYQGFIDNIEFVDEFVEKFSDILYIELV